MSVPTETNTVLVELKTTLDRFVSMGASSLNTMSPSGASAIASLGYVVNLLIDQVTELTDAIDALESWKEDMLEWKSELESLGL